MSEWQKIETAPKDGTWFVTCRAGEPDSYEVGRYEPWLWDRFVPVGDGLYRVEKEKLYDWRGFNNFPRATHWMTLLAQPPAPEDRNMSDSFDRRSSQGHTL